MFVNFCKLYIELCSVSYIYMCVCVCVRLPALTRGIYPFLPFRVAAVILVLGLTCLIPGIVMCRKTNEQTRRAVEEQQNQVHSLQWRYNGCDGVSNHQLHDCLLNRLFRRRSKKTSKLRVTGLCEGNSLFPSQRTSNAENVSIWWRHHVAVDIKQY